jgi:hypothetical protein
MVARSAGLSIDRLPSMPYGVAFNAGRFLETLWPLLGRTGDPPLSRSMVRMIGRDFTTTDAAARRELGYVGNALFADGWRLDRSAMPEAA